MLRLLVLRSENLFDDLVSCLLVCCFLALAHLTGIYDLSLVLLALLAWPIGSLASLLLHDDHHRLLAVLLVPLIEPLFQRNWPLLRDLQELRTAACSLAIVASAFHFLSL